MNTSRESELCWLISTFNPDLNISYRDKHTQVWKCIRSCRLPILSFRQLVTWAGEIPYSYNGLSEENWKRVSLVVFMKSLCLTRLSVRSQARQANIRIVPTFPPTNSIQLVGIASTLPGGQQRRHKLCSTRCHSENRAHQQSIPVSVYCWTNTSCSQLTDQCHDLVDDGSTILHRSSQYDVISGLTLIDSCNCWI